MIASIFVIYNLKKNVAVGIEPTPPYHVRPPTNAMMQQHKDTKKFLTMFKILTRFFVSVKMTKLIFVS
jgi:hypothetical protein